MTKTHITSARSSGQTFVRVCLLLQFLAIAGCFCFAKNAYSEGEAEQIEGRSGPSIRIANSEIPHSTGKSSVLLYNYQLRDKGDGYNNVVLLQIPEQFMKPSNEALHAWGINLLVFYPAMSGARIKDNAANVDCVGYCNGRILISLSGSKGNSKSVVQRRLARLNESMQRGKDYRFGYHIERVQNSDFDEVYSERTYIKNAHFPDKVIYVKHSDTTDDVLFAECDDAAGTNARPFPICRSSLSMHAAPGVDAEYIFPGALLPQWQIVQRKVAELIQSFYVGDAPFEK